MADHRTPFTLSDERQTLLDFLGYLRECVVRKAADLDEDTVRRPGVPSGTSLLGLIKHLTRVEVAWFQWVFAGLEITLPANDLTDADTPASVMEAYRRACRESDAICMAVADLDRLSARAGVAPEPMSLRWILVHMVEETARHAGHADILREQIDGATGR